MLACKSFHQTQIYKRMQSPTPFHHPYIIIVFTDTMMILDFKLYFNHIFIYFCKLQLLGVP
jgi:hypothetical protein